MKMFRNEMVPTSHLKVADLVLSETDDDRPKTSSERLLDFLTGEQQAYDAAIATLEIDQERIKMEISDKKAARDACKTAINQLGLLKGPTTLVDGRREQNTA